MLRVCNTLCPALLRRWANDPAYREAKRANGRRSNAKLQTPAFRAASAHRMANANQNPGFVAWRTARLRYAWACKRAKQAGEPLPPAPRREDYWRRA